MQFSWGKAAKTLVIATAMVGASTQFSKAADLLGGPGGYAETHVEFGTGWYIRGDISIGSSLNFEDTGASGFDNSHTANIPQSFTVGAGMQISPDWRFDVTLDRFGELVSRRDGGACAANINNGNCNYASEAIIAANAIMINGYHDGDHCCKRHHDKRLS